MSVEQRVLLVDAGTGFYRVVRYPVRDFFGPVDLGLHLAGHHNSLNIGAGLLAGSILPGSNRLVLSGMSPCWDGFYVSSMGGAALVFDNLGLSTVAILGRAPVPSLLYLNRSGGEQVEVELHPVGDLDGLWRREPGGVYAVMREALERFADRYATDPRVLAVGPAAAATDFGGVASAPLKDGRLTPVDTWAGRGGLGSKLLQQHNVVGVIYGGTFVDDDFRDRKVADQWFETRFKKKLLAKDVEATVKYRFDPQLSTGGTFGVNFASLGGRLLAFNYRSIYLDEAQRLAIHQRLVVDHYLRQFNEETIQTRSQSTCGEPCPAVCKKMRGEFKKDYEPYQTMGPLCGVFDQRAAEKLNHHADALGFDAISVGGVLAWLMEGLDQGFLQPAELGVGARPVFAADSFRVETDSMHNADLGVALLDAIVERRGVLDLARGARRWARRLARERGRAVVDSLLYTAFGRRGWMLPNQYWTPGVLAPMPIMGKYYNHYGAEFLPPRELGRRCAARLQGELVMDDLGMCRFHRQWAEEMLPEILGSLYGLKEDYLQATRLTAVRLGSRNAAVFWESERNLDFVHRYLERRHEVDGDRSAELERWLEAFRRDKREAGVEFWFECLKGIHESLREV